MKENSFYKAIKHKVHLVLPNARIVLFGSRARGDSENKSDYDLLIITKQNFTVKEKQNYTSQLNFDLVNSLKVPFDILLNSEKEIDSKKELPGHIVRWAIKEGITL